MLLYILLLLIGLLIWVLLIPIVINIDSRRGIYELQLKSIGRARVSFKEDQFEIEFKNRLLRRTWKIDPFKPSKKKKKKKDSPAKKRTKKVYSFSKIQHKAKRIVKSFQLKKLWLNIDTSDYYYNGLLYPIFYFIKGKNYQMNINFNGDNDLLLVVQNRPIRILIALIF